MNILICENCGAEAMDWRDSTQIIERVENKECFTAISRCLDCGQEYRETYVLRRQEKINNDN